MNYPKKNHEPQGTHHTDGILRGVPDAGILDTRSDVRLAGEPAEQTQPDHV